MYEYHGSSEHEKRLATGRCRCASEGQVHDMKSLLKENRIMKPPDLEIPLSTPGVRRYPSDPQPHGAGYGATYIFAVSAELEVHIAPDSERGLNDAVKHETLFRNEHVLAAGEISIQDGVITALNDHSGSYGTVGALEVNPDFARAILEAFQRHDYPMNERLLDELQNLSNP